MAFPQTPSTRTSAGCESTRELNGSREEQGERPVALEISRHGNSQVHQSPVARHSSRREVKGVFESSLIGEGHKSGFTNLGRPVVTLAVRETFGPPIIGADVRKERSRGR